MLRPTYPVFFYAQELKRGPLNARTRGELRQRGKDAAAKFGNKYPSWVYGQVRWLSKNAIKKLALYEHPQYNQAASGCMSSGRGCYIRTMSWHSSIQEKTGIL